MQRRPAVLLAAPFERGLPHGGSQRSTAIAERLEARGVDVRWHVVPRRSRPAAARVAAAVRGVPSLVSAHDPPAALPAADVVLAAHSYLATHLGAARAPVAVDFQDLEWQHLADVAAGATGPRRAWLAGQRRLVRRHEERVLRTAPLALTVSSEDRAWALGVPGRRADVLEVPNRLPAAVAEQASRVADARAARPPGGPLLYVGTLAFPPNRDALRAFVRDVWPVLRARRPGLTLQIAGGVRFTGHDAALAADGVEQLGFVADLEPLLAACTAAVLPVTGAAGSSLRALLLARSGVPVVGSPLAFRGHPALPARVAAAPAAWAARIDEALALPSARDEEAVAAAERVQADEAPWDALATALEAVAGRG